MLINKEKSKLVLVTGATGFLGSHLVKRLLAEKYQVIILKRSFSNTERINDILSNLSIYDIDKCDLETPFYDHKKIDVVIHTATCYGRKNESITDVLETNTLFPLKLLEIATFFKADTFFNTDTILSKYINSYSLSKKHFLDWGKQFAVTKKIHFINLKLEQIFGEGDNSSQFVNHVIRSFLSNVEELKLTQGEQKRDFIYIADVVSAYMVLLSNIQLNSSFFIEYEIGSGQAISIKEFVQLIHNLTKSKTRLSFGSLPYRQGEIMCSEASIKPLLKMGWQPQYSLESGLCKTMDYELQHLYPN
ncbi:NAD-dependent epimerase/dehydratase family protein [Nostoc sp.]|uniref:NAD-dependent epimerase/dehydratase family protein n=1 Tax=Nostoc sp. TaxID=1180 RepID=UPI002FF520C0